MLFRVDGVIYAALLTLAALATRRIIPCSDLALDPSTFWASLPCLYCLFSHAFYFIMKSLFWTLLTTLWQYPSFAARLEKDGWDRLTGSNYDLTLISL